MFAFSLSLSLSLFPLLAATTGLAGEPELRWLGIERLTGELEMSYESENRERTEKSGGTTTRFVTSNLRKLFTLGTRGYMYHPRFLQFTAELGFSLDQTKASVTAPNESTAASGSSGSPQYSIAGVFFPQHPVSLSFDLQRHRTVAAQAFGSLSVNETESQDVRLVSKDQQFPAEVFYSRHRSDQQQQGIGENRQNDDVAAGFSMGYETERTSSQVRYQHGDSTESTSSAQGAFPAFTNVRKTHEATFNNRLLFGEAQRNFLSSRLDWTEEAGSFPRTRSSLDEALRLTHSKSLSSDYNLRFSRETVGASQIDFTAAQATLTHQLYESLLTSVEAHGSSETFDGVNHDLRGGSLSADYRKRGPHGTLLLSLGGGYEVSSQTGQNTVRPVVDESHALSDASAVCTTCHDY